MASLYATKKVDNMFREVPLRVVRENQRNFDGDGIDYYSDDQEEIGITEGTRKGNKVLLV